VQFLPGADAALRARDVVILCDQIDQPGQHGTLYSLAECAKNAENLFSRRPRWVPRSAQSRAFLSARLDREDLADVDLPVPFNPDRFRSGRHRPSSSRPVIGRHVADHPSQWPTTDIDLLSAYPDDDQFDVRIMGGTDAALEVLQASIIPPNWVSFAPGQLPVRAFLAQLDFFVYFHHPQLRTTVSREALEAMASGCVVVLPPDFGRIYGNAAVYCQLSEVTEIVRELHSAPAGYAQQQERGLAYVESQNGSDVFTRRLMSLVRGGVGRTVSD
jgi:O-antigen biosynthesis protein